MKKILSAGFLALLVFVYGLSYGANYKMVCDDLDQTGGKGSSTHYTMMISAGGQSSPIGSGNSTNYKLMAGYVGATFVQRGDVNADGIIDVTDVVYLIAYKFYDPPGPPPIPWEAGDPDCDGVISVTDVVYLINYKFLVPAGPPPCDP